MKTKDIHYIPLIDVGVSLSDEIAITDGLKRDVFLKNITKVTQPYVGRVWPGSVHYVDFLHPNASDYWCSQLDRLYSQVPFSGVWLDMN
jgi:alpha-glucosidase (family GH31 glycosyl hydrolase)